MSAPQLYLITPVVDNPAAFASVLEAACAAGPVAAVQLRLAPADERTLVNAVKTLSAPAQARGAAVVVAVAGPLPAGLDLASVAVRGGADGVHTGDLKTVRDLRQRLKGERILGVGGLRAKHDAMDAGEAGVDYLMFGEPRPDGSLPPLETLVERAAWWAEIFETPCVAHAPTLEAVDALARTGAEFVALGDAVWSHPEGPAAAVKAALAILTRAGAPA